MSPDPKPASLVSRLAVFGFGMTSYLLGVVSLVGLILAMLGVLPFTGGPLGELSAPAALGLNLLLLVLFALQHSIMARPAFKARWTKLIPKAAERACYVLATAVFLVPTLWLWQPMSTEIWSVETTWLRFAFYGVALFGWAYLFLASFAINHFELFGVQQVVQHLLGREVTPAPFKERLMYRFDRHPIMTGMLLGMWIAPTMTLGHFVFAFGFSVYIVVGVYFEERTLYRQWGDAYLDYAARVGTLVPSFLLPAAPAQGEAVRS